MDEHIIYLSIFNFHLRITLITIDSSQF